MKDKLGPILLAGLVAILALTAFAGPAVALPIHFVIGETERFHGDSYVLPLEEPHHIAHARDLIDRGVEAGAPIILARIAEGADGVNRNVLAPGEPLWSWHVVEFLEFADATIEILDGSPTLVEQDVRGWIDNTGGIIGFWEYTVTAELHSVREPGTAGLLSLLLLALAVVAISRGKSEVIGANARGAQGPREDQSGYEVPHRLGAKRLSWRNSG